MRYVDREPTMIWPSSLDPPEAFKLPRFLLERRGHFHQTVARPLLPKEESPGQRTWDGEAETTIRSVRGRWTVLGAVNPQSRPAHRASQVSQ